MAIEHFGNKLRFFPHRAGLEIEGQQVASNLLDHVAAGSTRTSGRWFAFSTTQQASETVAVNASQAWESNGRRGYRGYLQLTKTGGGPVPSGSRGKDWTERMPGIIAGMVW